MDWPPPYNPAYERASAPAIGGHQFQHFSPHSPSGNSPWSPPYTEYADSPPSYQPPNRQRSSSVRSRRPAPPPPHSASEHRLNPGTAGLSPPPRGSSSSEFYPSRHSFSPSGRSSFSGCSRNFSPSEQSSNGISSQPVSPQDQFMQSQGCRNFNSSSTLDRRPRRTSDEPRRLSTHGPSYKCFTSFATKGPVRLAISSAGKVLIVDSFSMTAGVFTRNGEKSFEVKVVGVQGGCFWTEQRVALATARGVTIWDLEGQRRRELDGKNGKITRELTVGPVVNTKSYNFGFIAVQKQQLLIYSGSECQLLNTISSRKKAGVFHRTHGFKSIADVAVNNRKEIVVLDGGNNEIYIINEAGLVQLKLQLLDNDHFRGGAITNAFSIAVASDNAIIISDQGNSRVLRVSTDGLFNGCLVDFVNEKFTFGDVHIYAIEISNLSELFIAVLNHGKCAVRIYSV